MNLKNLPFKTILVYSLVTFALSAFGNSLLPENPFLPEFLAAAITNDTIPLKDRQDDFISQPAQNPFDLKDPSIIKKEVDYDPVTGQYIVTEKIGDDYFRAPTYLTFEEYLQWKAEQDQNAYFEKLSGSAGADKSKSGIVDPLAKFDLKNNLIDRLFGGTKVDIRPQGNIDLDFGWRYSRTDNPGFVLSQQRQGTFNFQENINMSVQGKIGEKLNLNFNYNSKPTFDFDNQMKLNYDPTAFSEDDIIQNIEAGNVTLPLQGTLIQGAQSLFGIRLDTKWGPLKLSTIIAQQKSNRENLVVQGGAQFQEFEVFADQYDENRHFFMSHYNRETFEGALVNMPAVQNVFQLEKVQVFLTDDRNVNREEVVDIVAFADLAEPVRIVNKNVQPAPVQDLDVTGKPLPDNEANSLYQSVARDSFARKIDKAVSVLQGFPYRLQQGRDFEKVSAQILREGQHYTVHKELGFVSLNVNVQPDQVVGISYQFSYNGKVYQVGEFANDVPNLEDSYQPRGGPNPQPGDTTRRLSQTVVFTKMLKSATQRIDLPMWDLMMKNVYNIGAFNVNREDFQLDIYYDDAGKGDRRFLLEESEPNIHKVPLLRVFNLDNLNVLGDPCPDGVFDFVPNLTIHPRNGRIMFPVLEPFGSSLSKKFQNPDIASKYDYQMLYDSTVTRAREYPDKNRFVIRGIYKGSSSNEITLNAFNIPQNSLRVTAGGQLLTEGIDYTVDYGLGRVKVLNDAYISSGVPINVSFEDNSLFGFQQKNLIGVRADYDVNKNLKVGGTYMHLFERPYTQKVNIGDDPINNRVYGLDFNWGKEAPWLTKAVDAIPFIETKAKSNLTITAEAAAIQPGHSRAINEAADKAKGGVVYIDDFEGSVSNFTLATPVSRWVMASVPQNDLDNNNPRFPESLADGTASGVNRALMNWYQVEDRARSGSGSPYSDFVDIREIFRNTNRQSFQNLVRPLDLSYYPDERGPYNFDIPGGTKYSKGIDFNGKLNDPKGRWAGIMRDLPNNDFEAANIEFVEFWLMSPFLNDTNDEVFDPLDPSLASYREGNIYLNLGNISEDLLKDSRLAYENGLPGPEGTLSAGRQTDNTPWGRVPNGKPIINAFDNEVTSREAQDVGFDGLNDDEERTYFTTYLNEIKKPGNLAATVQTEIETDPSNDNFRFFLDPVYDENTPVRDRYKDYNNPQGNSPVNQNSNIVQSSQLTPDTEDLNNDKTLNESEAYFQYKIPIKWDGFRGIAQNEFLTDSVMAPNGRIWYRFKIPIDQFDSRVGGIQDFRSVRFIRMYLADFEGPVTMRFAELNLGRNQWRRYKRPIKDDGPSFPDIFPEPTFDVNDVNIEENSTRRPFNYVLPEGIRREETIGGLQQNLLQNEQSLALTVNDLTDGYSRAIYKLVNLDFRIYDRLKMFVHAETPTPSEPDSSLSIFMRFGSDFEKNYYEYEIPLTYSRDSFIDPSDVLAVSREVWKKENEFDFPLNLLTDAKVRRNSENASLNTPYEIDDPDKPRNKVRIIGNPDLGRVKGVMVGVRNAYNDGLPHSAQVWINELRVNGLDERGGVAALARMDATLADFGQLTAAAGYGSIGYGAIDQKLIQRSQEENMQYDLSANLQLGKFFAEDFGLKIPFLAQYSNNTKTPRFEPISRDLELKEVLKNDDLSENQKDSIRNQAITKTEIKSFNFNNVRKDRSKGSDKLSMPWNIENFTGSFSYTETKKQTPFVAEDNLRNYYGGLEYQYTAKPLNVSPFKKLVKKDKYLKFITEFNFNPIPSTFSFGTAMDRDKQTVRYRFAGDDPRFNTFYNKRFIWDRDYNLGWDLTKSLKLTFTASNQAVIDELKEFDEVTGNLRTKEELNQNNWDRVKELGRTKLYQHNFSANYNVPLKNFPFMDWVTVRAQYNSGYIWTASALNTESLGNVIQNNQKRDVSADLKMDNLYNKWKYLKKINTPKPAGKKGEKKEKKDKKPEQKDQNGADDSKPDEKKDDKKTKEKKKDYEPSGIERAIIRPLLSVRSVRLRYNEDYSTIVPGFVPQSKLFGQNKGFEAPGWGFVAGLQPDDKWFDKAADRANNYANPWITTDFFLNQKVQQTYTQTIDGKVSIEPFTDFRIDVDLKKKYTENHTELFKDRANDGVNLIERLLPQDMGSLDITYFSAKTLFDKDENGVALFNKFEANREIISRRSGDPNTQHSTEHPNFTKGYGPLQMDVLIPSFVSAYTGSDPSTTKLDIFKTTPRPNWTLNYNGLSKIGFLKELFSSVAIKHGYKSQLLVNSFNTNLNYNLGAPTGPENLNPETQSYYSRLEVPNVVVKEGFSPLLGVDIRTKNDISINFSYDKTRDLRMDFFSYQLSENKATNYRFTFGYLLKGVKFGFLQGKKSKKKKEEPVDPNNPQTPRGFNQSGGGRSNSNPQDLNINCEFSLQDQITINHLLDQDQQEPTRGQKQIRFTPSADYQYNKRLNFRLYVEYTKNIPKTSATPPRTEIYGGITVSFTLN